MKVGGPRVSYFGSSNVPGLGVILPNIFFTFPHGHEMATAAPDIKSCIEHPSPVQHGTRARMDEIPTFLHLTLYYCYRDCPGTCPATEIPVPFDSVFIKQL